MTQPQPPKTPCATCGRMPSWLWHCTVVECPHRKPVTAAPPNGQTSDGPVRIRPTEGESPWS